MMLRQYNPLLKDRMCICGCIDFHVGIAGKTAYIECNGCGRRILQLEYSKKVKKSKWIANIRYGMTYQDRMWICSNCNEQNNYRERVCPNCKSLMEV